MTARDTQGTAASFALSAPQSATQLLSRHTPEEVLYIVKAKGQFDVHEHMQILKHI